MRVATFACVLALIVSPTFGQELNMVCWNQGGSESRLSVPTSEVGKSQASFAPVQFNVNRAAVPGTIFVNDKNDGVCEVAVDSGFILTKEVRSEYSPNGSWTEGSDNKSQPAQVIEIQKSVSVVPTQISLRKIHINVKKVGGSAKGGTVTLIFFVSYKPD
jgi:hypothetical protein